ncbi:hypothetical protein AMECASPLE_029068 [Ameca splendens]|uniref:Uncharacterized protein n=1 Tax=Ameca splendens TaxID=208324 RepID=A0ABV0ZRN0_9TELE
MEAGKPRRSGNTATKTKHKSHHFYVLSVVFLANGGILGSTGTSHPDDPPHRPNLDTPSVKNRQPPPRLPSCDVCLGLEKLNHHSCLKECGGNDSCRRSDS